jgi:hypothetical protein
VDVARRTDPNAALAGFGVLLSLLLVDLVVVIGLGGSSALTRTTQLVVAGVTLALAGFGSRLTTRASWAAIVVAATGIVLGLFLLTAGFDDEIPAATDIAAGCLYLFGALACSYRVLRQERVTLETVLGALSVYLLLAFAFGACFSAIQTVSGDPFFAQVDGPAGISDFLYFSLTTLTTLGYGDLTSALSAGRAVSALEALVGQLFLATFVARSVGAFQRERSGRGA